jgi:RNA polymerase sigma-70 factor, ECF subfamily
VADDEAQEAIREAYQAYYRRLVATLYGLTADYAEAQDLVQEAYARALARPKTFLDVADPEAWLRTVAVNLARTRWRRRRLLDTMIRTGRVTPTPESVPGADPTRVLLVAALAKLSRPTRETIVLHHIADMSVQEVAEQLGIPVGTVKARLSRGRALLAELLHDGAPTLASGRSPRSPANNGRPGRVMPARGAGILPVEADGTPVGQAGQRAGDLVAPGRSDDHAIGERVLGGRRTDTDVDMGSCSSDIPTAVGPVDDLPHQRAAADRIGASRSDDAGHSDGLDRLLDDPALPAETLVTIRGRRR